MKFISCLLLAFILTTNNNDAFCQTHLKGKVINQKSGKPIPFATVSLNRKRLNALSDLSGNFILSLNGIRKNDSLSISSVGYTSLRFPIDQEIVGKENEFALYEESIEMQPVVLKSYLNEEAVGSKSEETIYLRSWNYHNTGGEIGKIFYLNQDDYKAEKIKFKLNNLCDTCSVRLHIREVVDDVPGRELLKDSIGIIVNKLTFEDKASEFDLRPYEVILKNRTIYIGMEILNCKKSDGEFCSVCFVGTEDGNYLYKSDKYADWAEFNISGIYLRFFYKY